MRDLFFAGRAVLRLVFGGIEFAWLAADSRVLREITRSKVTITY